MYILSEGHFRMVGENASYNHRVYRSLCQLMSNDLHSIATMGGILITKEYSPLENLTHFGTLKSKNGLEETHRRERNEYRDIF